MTRKEQLRFCKSCLKRRFNPKKGVVCGLTDEIADFDVTCKDYDRDENVRIQEPEIKRKKKSKVKRKKTKREKAREVITTDDLSLILGFVLTNVLLIQLIFYFNLGHLTRLSLIIFLLITFLSISVALLLRDKKGKGYRFFGDLKFKVLYTLALCIVNILFLFIIKTVGYINIGSFIFSNLFYVFIASMLTYIVVKPIHFLLSRKQN